MPCAGKGSCQRSLPSATLMPTRLLSVSPTTCFTPATVISEGEAYAGPSTAQRHFSAPVVRSNAIMAPLPPPPRCAMARPSTMMGEKEVKKRGTTLGNSSLRHRSLPSAAFKQDRTPPTPSVTTLPSATAGEHLSPPRAAGPPRPHPPPYLSPPSAFPPPRGRR